MFLNFGAHNAEKVFGYSQRTYYCKTCNVITKYKIFRRTIWFTIFFIPMIPASREYYMACPMCNWGRQIKKAEVQELVQKIEQ